LIRPDGTGRDPLVKVWGGASWSHDGSWLYYMTPTDDPAETTVERIPVGGGTPEIVLRGAAGAQVASDGTTAYFSPSDLRRGEIWKVDLTAGEPPQPLRTDLAPRIPLWPHQYALSPDDRWLASPLRDGGTTNLWLISTEDGSFKQVTDFQRRATMIARQVSWSGDSRYLFAAVMEADADIVLLRGVLSK
jgi:Tol biopolymer transport system component